MAVTIVETPGAANANSFEALAEAKVYFASRIPIAEWTDASDAEKSVFLVMATRTLVAILSARQEMFRNAAGVTYRRTTRTWTGLPTTTTQALPWPRTGMYNRNGGEIASNVIPQELKDAESELAGQLAKGDRTLDNDVIVQGLTSVKAASVSLTFKDLIEAKVIPDAVWNLLVPSWLTEEVNVPALSAMFDVVS